MPHRQVRTPVEQLQPFEWGRILDLHETCWMCWRIALHSMSNVGVMCQCVQRWPVEHSHTHRPGSGWLLSIDLGQGRRFVASSGGRPNSIQGRNPDTCCTCCSERTIGNRLLATGMSSGVFCPGYQWHHDIVEHGYSGVVKEFSVWMTICFN